MSDDGREWEYRIILDGSDDGPHRALNDGSLSVEDWRTKRDEGVSQGGPDGRMAAKRRLKAGPWELV
jgi:hypothetical protein